MKLNQLSGIRGISAWWVVFFHSLVLLGDSVPLPVRKVLAHGYLAVDLFFLLSGFVIFLNYRSALLGGYPQSLIKFYWNRFTRIYPLHFIMLCAYLVLFGAFVLFSKGGRAPEAYTMAAFVQSLLLVHMWVGGDLTWNVPSWSISAEWFVYLFFPAMAVGLHRYHWTLARHLLAGLALAALLHLIYVWAGVASLGDNIPRLALIRTMLEFLGGVLLGSLYVNHDAFLRKYRTAAFCGFVGCCAIYAGFDTPDHLVVPAAFAMLIAFLCVDTSWISAALASKTLVYLGEISYSTYMVHYFVYDLLKAGFVSSTGGVKPAYVWLSFAAVLLLSVVLHHLIDMPAQRYFRSLRRDREESARARESSLP